MWHNKFSLICIIVLLLVWFPVNAVPPQGIVQYGTWKPPKGTYPWDLSGSPACSDKSRKEKPPYCKKNLPDWPDFQTTTKRVRTLITNKKLKLLSKAANELAASSRRFSTGEFLYEAWNQAMKYFTYRDDDNRKKKFSEKWIASEKGNGFSIMTRALLQYSKGVDRRYYNIYESEKNSPEVMTKFRESLKAANKTLDSAPEKIKKTPLWFEYKLKISYQLPELTKSANKIFKEAVKHWPQYPALYTLAYVNSHPHHGGSYKAMEKVMETALTNSKKQIGLAMYPMLITESWNDPTFDFKLTYSKIDWKSMKQGFKDYEKYLGGNLKYFFRFAELACKNNDLENTKHFYQRHKKSLMERFKDRDKNDPVVVRAFSQENECRDWALTGKKRKFKLTRLERQKMKTRNHDIKKIAKFPDKNVISKNIPGKQKAQNDWQSYRGAYKGVSQIFTMFDASNDLDDIQAIENRIAFSKKRFKTGEYYFEPWINYLNYHFKASYLFEPAFENDRAKFIEKWIKHQKGQGYSTIVKAMALYGKATDRFNFGYPKQNSPGTMVNYAKYLMQANDVLDSASPKVKQTAAWFLYKLKIAYQHPKLKPAKEKLLDEATNAWPEYFPIYSVAYAYSHPKWGGSYEAMEKVAQLAVKKSGNTFGAALYPLTILRARIHEYGYEIPYGKFDWELMKKGFRDYQKLYVKNKSSDSIFLTAACTMGDMKEARRLFPIIEKAFKSTDKWSRSLQLCRKIAYPEDNTGKNLPPPLIRKPGI